MAAARSLLFAILFYAWTAVCVLASFPASLIGVKALRACAHFWARSHRFLARRVLGIRTRVEGEIASEPVLYAIKHQSMYETLEIFVLFREPAVVLKRELLSIPFWGWVVGRYGSIPVDREGGAASLRSMMKSARQAIDEGRPIVIFPEGTRVSPGEQPPLQSGFAGIYRAIGLPVVPVALDSGRVSPRRSFVKRPGVVTMRFAEAIPPGLKRDEIEARVHSAINALEQG